LKEEEALMKAPRVRLRTLLLVIALSAVILAGVAGWLMRPVRPHSSVFTGLDPVALLGSKPGYQVKSVTTWNVFNASHGHAYREWHGIVTAPDVPSAREMNQEAFEGYVGKLTHGAYHTEGSLNGGPSETPQDSDLPKHVKFGFNEGDRQGELHIWLFPDSSGTSVGFAIFLRDEPYDSGIACLFS
jgi:hypothetical protein